jgi:hypothetical protein
VTGFVRLYAKWPRVVRGNVDACPRTVVTRRNSRDPERRRRSTSGSRCWPRYCGWHRGSAVLVLRIVHDLSIEDVARATDAPGQ